MNTCPKAFHFCQNKINILPNTKKTIKYLPNTFKSVPKWQNFAKSGQLVVTYSTIIATSEVPYISAPKFCSYVEQRIMTIVS